MHEKVQNLNNLLSNYNENGMFNGEVGNTNGSAESAGFNRPNSVAIDSSGTIYISEYNANRIRKIIK